MLALLVYLCPPLAVLLTAPSSHALKNLGLTLLLYVPGVLHARAAVERYTVQRRYDAMMGLLEKRTVAARAAVPQTSAPPPKQLKRRGALDPRAA
jgi:uncharacterized membrane protein YqaE (UPF0057 family)